MACSSKLQERNDFTITMPAIPCSFPWRNHPDALQLKEISEAWLLDRSKHIPATCKSKLTTKLFSADHLLSMACYLLVTTSFANAASTQHLVPIVKLMNWYYMMDTCVDAPSEMGVDPTNATLVVESVLSLFEPGSGKIIDTCRSASQGHTVDHELAHILTSAADEWWSEMRAGMPLMLQTRFSEVFKGYLLSVLQEISFRLTRRLPDMHTYLRIRSQSLGWQPLAVLTEYTLGMEMDQEALTNPLLLALKECVCESIILVNDVVSFRKEYMQGDFFNGIMVLCFQKLLELEEYGDEHGGPPNSWPYTLATPGLLQECMFEAGEMIKKRDEDCVRLIEKIQGCPSLMQKPGMASYLEAMANNVSGSIFWHFATKNYGLNTNGINVHMQTHPPNVLDNIAAAHNIILRLSPIPL